MADPFKNLARGTPLSQISAEQIAGWNDASRAERQRKINGGFGAKDMPTTSTVCKVLNDSSGDLPVFAVTVIAGPVFNYDDNPAEFQFNTAAKVAAPGLPTEKAVVAILRDALKDQAIGRATIAGITPVKINVVDAGVDGAWQYADVADGNTDHMVMAHEGPARVLWKQSGTGEKWALVCLLETCSDGFFAEITQRGPPPYTYGFKEKLDNGDGTWSDKTGGATGTAKAWADMSQVSPTSASLVIRNATGGTFTVTADGTTSGQAYNVSSSTLQTAINGVLTGGATVVVSGSGTNSDPFVLTFSAARSPSVSWSSLTPNTNTRPARELQFRKILIGTIVRMWAGKDDFWFSAVSTTPVTVCVSGGGSADILAVIPNDA
jgi:hypothetical protein